LGGFFVVRDKGIGFLLQLAGSRYKMRHPVSRQTVFFSKGPPPCGSKAHKAVWLEITLFYGFWCFEITLLLKLLCGGRSFPQCLP